MTFKYDENAEMDLEEYFQKYKDNLPQLAVITGGIYGGTKFDDYASDQMMRFHRYITQPRVLAKQTTVQGEDKYLSIPIDTKLKFRVIKGRNKVGPEQDLKTILKQNKFPVFLSSDSDHQLFEVSILPTGRSCQLLITEERSEYYLQGHCMTNDQFNPCDVSTVVVIPDIKIAAVTGYTDKPDAEFKRDLKRFDEKVKAHAKFNDKDVDSDIRTVYVQKDVPKDKSDSDSDREYEYIEPPPPLPRSISNDSSQGTRTLPSVPSELPRIPSRAPSLSLTNPTKVTQEKVRQYENEKVKRCTVSPIVKEENYYEPELDVNYETMPSDDSNAIPVSNTNIENNLCTADKELNDVNGKSLNDVIEILNTLKLSKYAEMFEEDMVDGMTLNGFTVEELKHEYKMRHAEAVRLINFVRHGHIPQ